MSQYRIAMKNCAFFARHGLYSEEETLGQRFFVDAVFTVDAGQALVDDSIEGTLDYGVAYELISQIVLGERRYLIESLALTVARALCDKFPMIVTVDVTIRKPNAPVQGVLDYVEVTVTHSRDAA